MGFWDTNGSPNVGQTTRPSDGQQKKNLPIVGLYVSPDHRVNIKESEKRDKNIDLVNEQKKTMEYECNGDSNCNWCARNNFERIGKRTKNLKIKEQLEDHPDYSIRIGQNTEKRAGDLRTCCHSNSIYRLSAIVCMKNCQRVYNNNNINKILFLLN